MTTPLRVLIVDDSEDDARLLTRQLARSGFVPDWTRVETREGFREALAKGGWQVVIADLTLPRFSGQEALAMVQQSGLDPPFIFVSGTVGEERAVDAMRLGAHDYVMKNNLARLGPAVEREVREAVERARTIDARRRAEEALQANAARLLQQEVALLALARANGGDPASLVSSLQRVTAVSARTLGVSRVSAWQFDGTRTVMRCQDLYELDRDRHSSGAELSASDHPRYFRSLAEHEVIAADDVRAEPSFGELVDSYLAPQGISSMMDAAVVVDGVVAGVICHEHVGPPRHWTHDERTFAVATANVVALVIEAMERKEAEKALRQSQQAYASLVNSIGGIVWEADADTLRFQFVSQQAERLLGYPAQQWLADPDFWSQHVHPDDRDWTARCCREAAERHEDRDFTYRMMAADGSVVWLHDLVTVATETGRRPVLRGIMVDVTESTRAEEARQQLESQLRQAQKMEAVGLLAGGVAHDFNNLLAVIQMQSSLLLTVPKQTAEVREGLQEIMAASERAANLTRQLLTFSRREVAQTQDIDLANVADGITKLLRRILGEQVTLESRVAHGLPLVHADPGMMEQVLMNLAVNAHDAMPNGGPLLVSLDAVTLSPEDVASQPRAKPGRFVRLQVQDRGCGIAAEDLPRIFEPFFTTKEPGKGTGLGLATAFGIVQQHHGWIDVASQAGVGTTFSVYLPALAPTSVASPESVEESRLPRGSETILLVEDEAAVRDLARICLEHCGYRVHAAASAAQASSLWDSLDGPVDLLLTDLVMPGGTSGYELAAQLLGKRPDLKVIYSSGYSKDVVDRELRWSAGKTFLQKPYRVGELATIVRRCLDER